MKNIALIFALLMFGSVTAFAQPSNAQILSQTAGAFKRTAAEISAGVTPVNYTYPVFNVLRYGADPTNTNDSSTAIQNAINVARAAGSGTVFIPCGTYKMASGVTSGNYPIFIRGGGFNCTQLMPTSGVSSSAVLGFSGTNNGLSDLSINCGNDTACTGLLVSGVNGFNADNFNIYNANIGIDDVGGVIHYYDNFQINLSHAFGVRINGGNDQYFTHGVLSNVGSIQATAGFNVLATGGLWLTDIDAISQGTGIIFDPPTGSSVQWVFINNSAFDTNANSAVLIEPTGGNAVGIDLTASWAATSDGNGVYIGGGSGIIDGVRLHGMRILNNIGNGVVMTTGASINNVDITESDISGNNRTPTNWSSATQYSAGNIVNCATASGCTGTNGQYYIATASSLNVSPPSGSYWNALAHGNNDGVYVLANVSGFHLNDNKIGQELGFSNTQNYGVFVSGGSSNNYQIQNNDLSGNVTAGLSDGGTGTTKIVTGNLGYNPLSSTSITVGGSPFTYTNKTGSTIVVGIVGGTLSALSVNGVAVAASGGLYTLPQGASMTLLYSATPTMSYYGLN